MAEISPEFVELKRRLKSAWMAGDFGKIARQAEHEGEEFVAHLSLKPGMRVLDVACGTGNQSLPAARAGAIVTGIDIAPNLLEQARERAKKENLAITFVEGDAEDLPYGPGEFDVVFSMFGAMFAPRPECVAAEFVRVCRPDGLIAMANWTPDGFVGQMFKITGRRVPPPSGVPAPVLWGVEAMVKERFGPKVRVEAAKREMLFDYPGSPADVVGRFREFFGPTKVAFAKLDATGQKELSDELIAHWTKYNQGDAERTLVRAEYLEVHAWPS
ncbi:MAG: class I SAM-dependent methyltransferase [Candidatus Acidiferrales bacterium]